MVQRGLSVSTPVVACLTNVSGQPMMKQSRRETTDKANAIVALVADSDVMVRVSLRAGGCIASGEVGGGLFLRRAAI